MTMAQHGGNRPEVVPQMGLRRRRCPRARTGWCGYFRVAAVSSNPVASAKKAFISSRGSRRPLRDQIPRRSLLLPQTRRPMVRATLGAKRP